jgi:tetratricopeptide (TPR) repeat protein
VTDEVLLAEEVEAADAIRATDPSTAGFGAEAPRPRSSRHLRWILIAAIPILFFASFGFELPQEIARWYLAAAREKFVAGDPQAAQALVDRAIQWDPGNPGLFVELARCQEAAGRLEACVESWTKAIEMNRKDASAYYQRAQVYCKLKRYREAVRDADRVLQMLSDDPGLDPSTALNNAAYYRSLAGDDLNRALREAETAVGMLRARIGHRHGVTAGTTPSETHLGVGSLSLATTLDTRGFIYYRLGNFPAAKADLDEAIDVFVPYCRKLEEMWLTADPLSQGFIREMQDEAQAGLGEMYYHRGLVQTGLGDDRAAIRDIERARSHGFPVDAEHAAGMERDLVSSSSTAVEEKTGGE